MTPVWKNEDLEGAVIGAIFLRGADPEVLDILSRVPATAFSVPQYREIYTGICRQARGAGVIDPVLLCENMPKHSAIIMDSSRIAWAKSALVSYVATLERNAAVRDAEAVIERALADLRSAHNGDAALSAFRAAQNSIAAISLEENTVQPVHIDDILPAVVDRVDARNRGLEEARSLMTVLKSLMQRLAVLNQQTWCLSLLVRRWVKLNWRWISSTKFLSRAVVCCSSAWKCQISRSESEWYLLPAACQFRA